MSIVPSLNPGSWPRILNMKQREFLVKNNSPQIRNFNFPKDSVGKKFSETYYTRILPNGEKGTRPWLLFSASKDSVFCLYCRLFGEWKNQLRNENGCKDWHYLSHLLSKHDESEMYINNSVKYSKLKLTWKIKPMRLQKVGKIVCNYCIHNVLSALLMTVSALPRHCHKKFCTIHCERGTYRSSLAICLTANK